MISLPRVPSRLRVSLLAVAMMTLAPRARAQDTTSTANLQPTPAGRIVVLSLVDGSSLQGRVLEVTPTAVRFESAIGETSIPRSAIRGVRTVDAGRLRSGQVWPEDPSRTRLFFAPTGRTLRQGEGYFADAYVFFPSVQIGVTNSLTLGGGLSIIPGVAINEQIFYITPKLNVLASPNLNVSVGALVAGAAVISSDSPFGAVYGVATFGGEDRNFTTGAGVLYSRAKADNSALLMLGGTERVSRSIALVSENYLYTGNTSSALLSGGMRFIGEKLSVDLAAFLATSEPTIPIPYVAFIYKF